MVLPALGMVAVRIGGGMLARRAIAGAGGSAVQQAVGGMAAQRAAGYGASALHRQHRNSQQAQQQRQQDHGLTQWARENPGEATVAATAYGVGLFTRPRLDASANASTSSILQSTQFH